VDVDLSDAKMQKKIALAQTAQYNFILIAGNGEIEHHTANVRCRAGTQLGEKSVEDVLKWFKELDDTKSSEY